MEIIVNLTPHDLHIIQTDSHTTFLKPIRGEEARVEEQFIECAPLNGIPQCQIEYGLIWGLPEPQEGVIYVISSITAQAARASGRSTDDLRIVADLVRDDQGRVIGARRLAFV